MLCLNGQFQKAPRQCEMESESIEFESVFSLLLFCLCVVICSEPVDKCPPKIRHNKRNEKIKLSMTRQQKKLNNIYERIFRWLLTQLFDTYSHRKYFLTIWWSLAWEIFVRFSFWLDCIVSCSSWKKNQRWERTF